MLFEMERSEVAGSLTAVISLICDNLVNLITFSSILTTNYPESPGAPQGLVTTHLFVGALVGVMLGNIMVYFYTKTQDKTLVGCIPIGIDAPTVFFMGYAVRAAFEAKLASGMAEDEALGQAWSNGAMIVLAIGLVKLSLTTVYWFWKSFMDDFFDKKMFGACLLSIGLSLLGMNNILGIFVEPVSGITSMFAFLMKTLPRSVRSDKAKDEQGIWKYIPHIAYSLMIGVPLYYILLYLPIQSGAEDPNFTWGFPEGNFMFNFRCDNDASCETNILGAVPFAFLAFTNGYCVIMEALKDDKADAETSDSNVQLSIALDSPLLKHNDDIVDSGEDVEYVPSKADHKTISSILLTDALCTILNALCGGLVQTTPYIGYSTYRKLGVKTMYSLWFSGSLFILLVTGSISFVSQALPQPVLKPIFILVALDLAQLALRTVSSNKVVEQRNNEYLPAIIMSLFPSMAHLLSINGNTTEVVTVLSNGFVITALLWGQVTLCITRCSEFDRKWAMCIFAVLAFLTNFGVIHSWNGEVYWDSWNQHSYLPASIASGYLLTIPICWFLMENEGQLRTVR